LVTYINTLFVLVWSCLYWSEHLTIRRPWFYALVCLQINQMWRHKDIGKQKWDVSSGVSSWHSLHITCNRHTVIAWLPFPFTMHRVSRQTDNVRPAAVSLVKTGRINCSSGWHWGVCVCVCACVHARVCVRARECVCVCVYKNVEWYGFWKYTCNYDSSKSVHVQMVCTGVHSLNYPSHPTDSW
jgi:hypothetical protein